METWPSVPRWVKTRSPGRAVFWLNDDQRRRNLEELFRLIEEEPLPGDFLSEATRQNDPPRNPFEEWAEGAAPRGDKK